VCHKTLPVRESLFAFSWQRGENCLPHRWSLFGRDLHIWLNLQTRKSEQEIEKLLVIKPTKSFGNNEQNKSLKNSESNDYQRHFIETIGNYQLNNCAEIKRNH
jgi:hypothetical protein